MSNSSKFSFWEFNYSYTFNQEKWKTCFEITQCIYLNKHIQKNEISTLK